MAKTNLAKNKDGYGYQYTDLAEIHNYLEENGLSYYQYIDRIDGDDYVMTVKIVDGKELPPVRGCRVVQATLSGKNNPAQEQGSALTYARRYSLLMAFGLATTDDDAAMLTREKKSGKTYQKAEENPIKPKDGIIETQIAAINNLLTDAPEARLEAFNKALKFYKVERMTDLDFEQAATLISRLRKY